MTSDASRKINNRNKATSGSQEFCVRTIAVWLLLLVPGLVGAFVSGQWLFSLLIGIVLAPLIVGAYDLCLFIRRPGNRVAKLGLFFLFGIAIALLLSPIGALLYTAPLTFFRSLTVVADTENTDSSHTVETGLNREVQTTSVQQSEGAAALAQSKALGQQAAEIVQNPPHPLPVWKSARQKWEQAIQHLDSVPSDSAVYEEAKLKLETYRANRDAIAQRIELEKAAANSYETGVNLIDELAQMTGAIEDIEQNDLTALKRIRVKLDTAIGAFETVASGTAVFELAQAQLTTHKESYQTLQVVIEQLETCNLSRTADCSISESIEIAKE